MKYLFVAVTLLTMSLAIPADSLRANCHDHGTGGRTLCCCETYGGGTCCKRVLICNTSMIGCGCKN